MQAVQDPAGDYWHRLTTAQGHLCLALDDQRRQRSGSPRRVMQEVEYSGNTRRSRTGQETRSHGSETLRRIELNSLSTLADRLAPRSSTHDHSLTAAQNRRRATRRPQSHPFDGHVSLKVPERPIMRRRFRPRARTVPDAECRRAVSIKPHKHDRSADSRPESLGGLTYKSGVFQRQTIPPFDSG